MTYPHANMNPVHNVGWYDASINDWYFAGEFGTYEQAAKVAQKVANQRQTKTRVITIPGCDCTEFQPE